MSDIDHKALIDAVNLLAEHVETHLPSGWQLILTSRKDECSLTLLDPDEEEHEVHADRNWSSWAEACITAQEIHNERQKTGQYCPCGRANDEPDTIGCSECLSYGDE
jgi:hypothetical protein